MTKQKELFYKRNIIIYIWPEKNFSKKHGSKTGLGKRLTVTIYQKDLFALADQCEVRKLSLRTNTYQMKQIFIMKVTYERKVSIYGWTLDFHLSTVFHLKGAKSSLEIVHNFLKNSAFAKDCDDFPNSVSNKVTSLEKKKEMAKLTVSKRCQTS